MERTAAGLERPIYQSSEGAAGSPILTIIGDLVALGPMTKHWLAIYCRWSNDLPTALNLGMCRPQTMEQESARYDQAAMSEQNTTFTIYERATWRPIGTTGLSAIDHRNRRAEFGIMIGEPDCRGKGYGTEATRLVLDYAFTVLGLHNVMLRVFAYNISAIRVYEKAGFREFGRRRECYLMDRRLWDDVYMECIATEYTSSAPGQATSPAEQQLQEEGEDGNRDENNAE